MKQNSIFLNKTAGLAVLIVLSAIAFSAQASIRCDNGIASEGDSSAQVIQKCGAPNSRDPVATVMDKRGANKREVINVEQWVYGPRGGMYQYLRFEGDKLVQIRSQR